MTRSTDTKAPATITYRQGPSDKLKTAKGWRDAGYVPADHIYVDFPANLMPDIAYITTTFRIGDRGLMLTLTPEDLTDDLLTGAELTAPLQLGRGTVITRNEAAARFATWQAKTKLRAV